jgi:hypothetical protein
MPCLGSANIRAPIAHPGTMCLCFTICDRPQRAILCAGSDVALPRMLQTSANSGNKPSARPVSCGSSRPESSRAPAGRGADRRPLSHPVRPDTLSGHAVNRMTCANRLDMAPTREVAGVSCGHGTGGGHDGRSRVGRPGRSGGRCRIVVSWLRSWLARGGGPSAASGAGPPRPVRRLELTEQPHLHCLTLRGAGTAGGSGGMRFPSGGGRRFGSRWSCRYWRRCWG